MMHWIFHVLAVPPVDVPSVATAQPSSDRAIILLGAFTLLGTMFTGSLAFLSNRHAKIAQKEASEVNNAVNHRQKGEPTLVEMVVDMHSSLVDIVRWRHHVDTEMALTHRRVDQLSDRLDDLREVVFGHPEHFWDGAERRSRQQPFDGPERRRRKPYDGPDRRRPNKE